MNFYHESYDKHVDCELRIGKSKEGLSQLTQRVEEIKQGSLQLKQKAFKVTFCPWLYNLENVMIQLLIILA
jgi:hypothetical protein